MSAKNSGTVGNGETVAHIGEDGAVDWLCVPGPDHFPVFARGRDPRRGGALHLTFRWGDQTLTQIEQAVQGYLDETERLTTSLLMDDINVTITDAMPRGRRHLSREIAVTNLSEERRGVRVGFTLAVASGADAPEDLRDRVYVAFKGPEMALLSPGESFTTVLIVAYGETPTEALRNWVEAEQDGSEAHRLV